MQTEHSFIWLLLVPLFWWASCSDKVLKHPGKRPFSKFWPITIHFGSGLRKSERQHFEFIPPYFMHANRGWREVHFGRFNFYLKIQCDLLWHDTSFEMLDLQVMSIKRFAWMTITNVDGKRTAKIITTWWITNAVVSFDFTIINFLWQWLSNPIQFPFVLYGERRMC